MSNKNWKNSEYHEQEPWDRGTYQTGYTRPPRRSRGLVALLLVIIIFLCGIVSILTMLNIRIFQEMAAKIPQETAAIDFIGTSTVPPAPASNPPSDIPPVEETTAPSVKSGGIQIHPSPESVPTPTTTTNRCLQPSLRSPKSSTPSTRRVFRLEAPCL